MDKLANDGYKYIEEVREARNMDWLANDGYKYIYINIEEVR